MLNNDSQSLPADEADAKQAQEQFEASKTFLLRTPDPDLARLRAGTVVALLFLFFAVIPLLGMAGIVPDNKIQILGQYLCFAIVALGVDLIWGYTGLLSLCQALFFALGAYAMGMYLSLPEGGGTHAYPEFMTFAYVGHGTDLPWFWVPFRHFWFALLAGIAVPGLIAALFGFVVLRNRVRGVYFSIITQAFAAAAVLLVARNEMLLGGSNGLTNFYRPMTADVHWKIGLYLLSLSALVILYVFCRAVARSRVGRVMIAVRDKETRLYFAGYKPFAFKVFAFSVAAMVAGIGGMLYVPQVTLVATQEMDVKASMLMVVMVALGGRGRLWGAVLGAILFRTLLSTLSSDLAPMWLLVEGLIAILVVLAFPDGLLGIWERMEKQIASRQGVPRIVLTAVPLVALCFFCLLEALGLMPGFLSRFALNLRFGEYLLYGVLIAAALLYWQWRAKMNWAWIGGLLGFDAVLMLAGLIGLMPQSLRDSVHLTIPIKYLLMTMVFAACAVLEWVMNFFSIHSAAAGPRGFEVVPPGVPAVGAGFPPPLPAGKVEGGV